MAGRMCGFMSEVSIHALLVECDREGCRCPGVRPVSIHALLVECDHTPHYGMELSGRFNPRTPCGVRQRIIRHHGKGGKFQSTHSLWSATSYREESEPEKVFQSTHSLWSATDCKFFSQKPETVSIHALLVECDVKALEYAVSASSFNPRTPCGVRPAGPQRWKPTDWFQSTHSLWSATPTIPFWPKPLPVSIHALLVECDPGFLAAKKNTRRFNPRTPCGVRRAWERLLRTRSRFNPRTPCGVRHEHADHLASIASFNPRTPCGVRHGVANYSCLELVVSIHALLVECDGWKDRYPRHAGSFNPRTPCGVRHRRQNPHHRKTGFQSTHSLWSATGK